MQDSLSYFVYFARVDYISERAVNAANQVGSQSAEVLHFVLKQ